LERLLLKRAKIAVQERGYDNLQSLLLSLLEEFLSAPAGRLNPQERATVERVLRVLREGSKEARGALLGLLDVLAP